MEGVEAILRCCVLTPTRTTFFSSGARAENTMFYLNIQFDYNFVAFNSKAAILYLSQIPPITIKTLCMKTQK